MKLSFTQPINVANPTVDPTAGRGYVDDGRPSPATQVSLILAERISASLEYVDEYVEENWGFNRTQLRPEERQEMVGSLGAEEVNALAGVFGRDRVANLLLENQRMLDQGAIPEEPPLMGQGALPEEPSLGY
jgi:hypothetical protein